MSAERRFLPASDPVWTFGEGANPNLEYLERLGEQLPELLEGHKLREIIDAMKPIERGAFRGLDRIIQFRQKHLEFAVNYIFTKVEDPSVTGGTPFMKWLAQLRDETAEHRVPS